MIIREDVLRDSAKLGFNAYVNWKKKETELKRKLAVYSEQLLEMYLSDNQVVGIIRELQLKIDELSFINYSTTKDGVIEFFKPLEILIEIEKSRLCSICQEMDYQREVWESNIAQGIRVLEMMQIANLKLDRARCTPALLLVIIHYFSKNKIYFFDVAGLNSGRDVVSQIIYPKSKLYNRFKEVFKNYDTYEAEFEEYWINEFPEYVVK